MDRRNDELFNDSELFIGLIAPTGSDRDLVIEQLRTEANSYGYGVKIIIIAAQIPKIIAHFKQFNHRILNDLTTDVKNNLNDDDKSYFDGIVNGNNGYELQLIPYNDARPLPEEEQNLIIVKQTAPSSYHVKIFNGSKKAVLDKEKFVPDKNLTKELNDAICNPLPIEDEIKYGIIRKITSSLDHRLSNSSTNCSRTSILMKLGTFLRKNIAEEVLFYFAIKELHEEKRKFNNTKFIYIFDSIKTPGEASLLRAVYGESVSLISIYTKEKNRERNIENRQNEDKKSNNDENGKAKKLIEIDENDTYGQQVRDTFPLADYFIETSSRRVLKKEISRFLSILFNYRFETPRRDEYCMFLAHAASLRSASLSRQVGAAICTADGSVVALGCNEVPKYGGGLYWPDHYDYRDHKIGKDTNDEMKAEMIEEVLNKLKPIFYKKFSVETKEEEFETKYTEIIKDKEKIIPKHLKGSDIRNILEFGRAVHAEMAVITDAAMRGIEIKNLTLYSTTFPCHMCARHIVSSGIKKVLYIEPYPKSKTEQLYSDSVAINPHDELTNRVVFEPYVGISPTSYIKSFTSPKSTRKNNSGIIRWDKDNAKIYDLFLKSIEDANKLPRQGINTAFVAKIEGFYHVRIFDSGGSMVVDKGKGEFSPDTELLKELNKALQMQHYEESMDDDERHEFMHQKNELMKKIVSNLNHTHVRLRFKEKDLVYLCREFTIKEITFNALKYKDNPTNSEPLNITKSIAKYLHALVNQ